MEKELNASEGIPTLLEAAIRRIERLEENHGLLQMQQTDSGMGDLNRAQEETETATHQHTRPIARSTSTGENRRPFHPPMRRLPVAVTSRTTSHMAAVNQDFRRSFPSLGGSGRRDAIVPKKARRQSCVIVAPKETYTHDFCLLAQKNATKTPSLTELTRLKEAGLGKRRITFDNKKSGHGKVRQVLETIYPKMKCQNGAFEILRGERGGVSVNLVLIPMSQDGYTVPYLKEQVSSNAVLYIRPMQSDLSLSKVTENVDVSIKTTCRTCNSSISLADMKSHLSRCTSTATSSSAYFEDSSDDDCFAESFQLDCMKTSSSSTVTRPESAEASSSIQTTLAEENVWMQTLQSLFPMHKEEHLQCSVKGAKSLEEAADTLLDSYGTTDVREILPSTSSCTATKNVTLHTLLDEFQIAHANQMPEELTVDRDALWSEVLKFYKKKGQQPSVLCNRLEVKFKSEDGLDGGAVMIEFFNSAWEQIVKRLFEGNFQSMVPVRDSSKLFLFRMTGIMIVHTVLQNGPVKKIPQLSPAIVSCMLGESVEEIHNLLSKHDIPMNAATENLHTLIEELDTAKSNDVVQSIFAGSKCDAYWQIVNACHWPMEESITPRNKSSLIQELIYNEVIRSRKDLIEEIKEGLETLGFFKAIASYPERLKELFVARSERFGSKDLQNLLEYDAVKDFAEEQARDWFSSLVADSDDPLQKDDPTYNIAEAILSFTTSWETMPMVNAKPTMRVQFLPDDDSHELPTSSACLKIIRIPTVHSTQGKFKDAIMIALKFGRKGFPNP